jgi:hypothetical protein
MFKQQFYAHYGVGSASLASRGTSALTAPAGANAAALTASNPIATQIMAALGIASPNPVSLTNALGAPTATQTFGLSPNVLMRQIQALNIGAANEDQNGTRTQSKDGKLQNLQDIPFQAKYAFEAFRAYKRGDFDGNRNIDGSTDTLGTAEELEDWQEFTQLWQDPNFRSIMVGYTTAKATGANYNKGDVQEELRRIGRDDLADELDEGPDIDIRKMGMLAVANMESGGEIDIANTVNNLNEDDFNKRFERVSPQLDEFILGTNVEPFATAMDELAGSANDPGAVSAVVANLIGTGAGAPLTGAGTPAGITPAAVDPMAMQLDQIVFQAAQADAQLRAQQAQQLAQLRAQQAQQLAQQQVQPLFIDPAVTQAFTPTSPPTTFAGNLALGATSNVGFGGTFNPALTTFAGGVSSQLSASDASFLTPQPVQGSVFQQPITQSSFLTAPSGDQSTAALFNMFAAA